MNAAVTDVRPIALKALVLSTTEAQEERRARFDKGALGELAKSLASTGQINPITVRPLKAGKFEIVAGERRYLAAGIAKLEQIVCSVRELTDEQVLEVQIIENLQREDLHELAEAEAYEKLVKMGRTPAQIAGQVHKDESYVRKRMRLLALGKKGRKAFYSGEISVAIALILARIPVEKLQDEALEGYLDEAQYSPVTAEEFRGLVQREYMTDLASAPFDIADVSLVPKAGACASCPKNTLGQGQLFDDIAKKAHCTDTVCFQAKRQAHGDRLLAKAKTSGREVITGKEAKRIAEHGKSNLVGYVDLGGHYRGTPVKKLLKGVDPAKLKLLQLPETGEVIEVAPSSLVSKAAPASSSDGNDAYKAQQRAANKKHQLEVAYRAELFRRVLSATNGKEFTDEQLQLVVGSMFARAWHDARVALFKAMGIQPVEKTSYGRKHKSYELASFTKGMDKGQDLQYLIRALAMAGDLVHSPHMSTDRRDTLHKMAQLAGVKPEKVLAELTAAAKEKAAKKPKAKKGKK